MDSAIISKIAEGVSRREYSLLLGAGTSMGSLGGNGQPLPSGPILRDKLVDEFNIPIRGATITLSRAYAAAKRANPSRLNKLIVDWFTGCTPDWQFRLGDFEWHRIWSLNIDDVMENVYQKRRERVTRFDWTSKFRDSSSAGTQIIHLHGFAEEDNEPSLANSNLVFSTSEYVATLKDPRSWHTVFTDEFADRPFIVLGASLVEEFDLQQALTESAAASSRGFPSVIVLKEVSPLEREELNAIGLIVIEQDAQGFMRQLYDQVQKYRETLQGLYGHHLSGETRRFLQQFIDLRQFQPLSNEQSRNFYSGYDPHWKNILDDDDALLATTTGAFALIQESLENDTVDQTVHILSGTSGVGKSTGLLRIAHNVISQGTAVFQFRGEEDLDVDAALFWLERMPRTVLLFNDCADFADSIGELADRCASENIKLQIVGSERTIRRNQLEHRIQPRFLNMRREYIYRTLSDKDIENLIDKLSSRRRLGHLTNRNRRRQRIYFKETASRRLFEGMANLEHGEGFRNRIRQDYRLIQDENLRRLYAASSIAYQIGYPIPLGIASRIAGMSTKQLEDSLRIRDQDAMVLETGGIRPPHRLTATMVVESVLSPNEKSEATQLLASALAPHIDIQAITRLTRPYRLLRRLMDQETVMRLLGPENGRVLYEVIQESCDWNGRYWEQRALFESELGNHAQARSYAEHSLKIHRHPFAFNTLGTVLGRIAIESGDAETLKEVIKNLEFARDERRWEASEHPYVTFFRTIIKFGEDWGLASIPTQLRSYFTEWYRRANSAQVFEGRRGESQLNDFQRRWLHLATPEGEPKSSISSTQGS